MTNGDVLAQYQQALDLLCGLHPCATMDRPPEEVAEMIFGHVLAEQKALRERIKSQERTIQLLLARPAPRP